MTTNIKKAKKLLQQQQIQSRAAAGVGKGSWHRIDQRTAEADQQKESKMNDEFVQANSVEGTFYIHTKTGERFTVEEYHMMKDINKRVSQIELMDYSIPASAPAKSWQQGDNIISWAERVMKEVVK